MKTHWLLHYRTTIGAREMNGMPKCKLLFPYSISRTANLYGMSKKKKENYQGHTVYLTQQIINNCKKFNKTKKTYDIVYRTKEDRHFQTDWDILNINWENFFLNIWDDLNVNFSKKVVIYGDDWLSLFRLKSSYWIKFGI